MLLDWSARKATIRLDDMPQLHEVPRHPNCCEPSLVLLVLLLSALLVVVLRMAVLLVIILLMAVLRMVAPLGMLVLDRGPTVGVVVV